MFLAITVIYLYTLKKVPKPKRNITIKFLEYSDPRITA